MGATFEQILAVAIGGAVGSVLRFGIAKYVQTNSQSFFPWGILTVNLIGSFLMGVLSIVLVEKLGLNMFWRLAILIGLLGGFTTFSSFAIDTVNLMRDGYNFAAINYIFVSVIFCLGVAWLGVFLGRSLL